MPDIKQRELKMQEKRKQTPWKEFVKDVCSRRPMNFYKIEKGISKYPNFHERKMNLFGVKEYENMYTEGAQNFREYDPEIPFFDQIRNLFYETPQPVASMYGNMNENADRGDAIRNGVKNAYLGVAVGDNARNVAYSYKVETNVTDVFDSLNVTYNCEGIYASKTIRSSRHVFYSQYIYDSSDIRFSSNLIGCMECIACNDLQNMSYCIGNQHYEKDEYYSKKKEFLKDKKNFPSYRKKYLQSGGIKVSENCNGDGIFKCKNVQNGYEIAHIQEGNNVLYSDGGNDTSDLYDCLDVASDRTHHLYGVFGQAFGDNIYCAAQIMDSSNIYYSYFIQNSSHCLGCVGLKNRSFCILNKQYSKEERFALANKIFAKMDADGTLGQFFLASMNPFYFNDTIAYLIDDSFSKEEVTKEGYLRRDEEIRADIPQNVDIVSTNDLSHYQRFTFAGEREINKDILKKVIKDDKGNYYRIMPMELEFLIKHGLPLPEIHRLERIKLGFKFK